MAKKYVPEGAFTACDKGTSPSTLRVTFNKNTTIYSMPMATEADLIPFFNLKPMGFCTSPLKWATGLMCIPTTPKWDNPKDGVKINGNRLLLEDSTCDCIFSGKIKIFFDRASAAAYGVGEGKMPTEYIKEGFDWLEKQTQQMRAERDSFLPDWMKPVAHVQDWFTDLGTGLVEGAINGVVGLGETIYQVAQDPVGTAEALYDMGKKGVNAVGEVAEWVSTLGNMEKAFDDAWKWGQNPDNWKKLGNDAIEGTKNAADWVTKNPRKIGNVAGEFIPDVAAAYFSGGSSLALSAEKIAAKEALEMGVEKAVKEGVEEATEKAAKEGAEALGKKTAKELLESLGDDAADIAKVTDGTADDIASGTFRDAQGRLRNKNGTFAKDPNKVPKTKKPAFKRSMSERKKALMRDAKDPNSELSDRARKQILDSKGNKVPKGYEVSHEKPLYNGKTDAMKKELDVADNMKTQQKAKHRKRHKKCGDQYHKFGSTNQPKFYFDDIKL